MDKETLKEQKTLVKDYWKDVDMIPVFINTTNKIHKCCREMSREIFSELSLLLEPRVIPVRCIEELFIKMVEINSSIMDLDPNIGLLYFSYISDVLEFYKTECENKELYESESNIHKFLEQYKNMVLIDE